MHHLPTLILGVCFVLAAFLPARPAEACTIATSQPHALDEDEIDADQVAPEPPATVRARIQTSHASPLRRDDCNFSLRTLIVEVTGASDDRTPFDRLGYRLEILDGTLPDGFRWNEGPFRALFRDEGTAKLHVLLPTEGDLRVSLGVRTVDLAGNESEPSDPVGLRHFPGYGCSVTHRGGLLPALLLLVLGLARVRGAARRRARRRAPATDPSR